MTTNLTSIAPVVKTIIVACSPEEAFQYFTADFSKWWPLATHSVVAYASEFKDKPAEVIFDPRLGGRHLRTRTVWRGVYVGHGS